MKNLANSLGKLSFLIFIVTAFLCVNYFAKIIPFIHLDSFVLFLPIYTCFFGLILAIISLIKKKNRYALWGLILNGIIILGEFIFILIGTKFLR